MLSSAAKYYVSACSSILYVSLSASLFHRNFAKFHVHVYCGSVLL